MTFREWLARLVVVGGIATGIGVLILIVGRGV